MLREFYDKFCLLVIEWNGGCESRFVVMYLLYSYVLALYADICYELNVDGLVLD